MDGAAHGGARPSAAKFGNVAELEAAIRDV
jgi:hypothetical protein